jgi:FkbM family methyltransferase
VSTGQDYLGQDLEIELIGVVAPLLRERFFLDVGAEKGRFAAAMFSHGLRGALFEPLARHHAALEALAARHQSRAYPFAIDSADGERDLHIATDASGNELDYFHSLQKVEGARQFRHSRRERVTCRSLASLAAEGLVPARVGILKTDTEGHDLGVLRGLGALRPELVVCEYFTEGLYAGWEEARPRLAIELMGALGYSRYLATKRVDELEYCAASPMGFLPRQWGNLFFLSDALFGAAESAIERFLAGVETRFIEGVQAMAADRVAKEAVIQGLLSRERDARKVDN